MFPSHSHPCLMVECPACGAKAGFSCVAIHDKRMLGIQRRPHFARLDAYTEYKSGFDEAKDAIQSPAEKTS